MCIVNRIRIVVAVALKFKSQVHVQHLKPTDSDPTCRRNILQ